MYKSIILGILMTLQIGSNVYAMNIHRYTNYTFPTSKDINPMYNTYDRSYIWAKDNSSIYFTIWSW